MAYTRINWKNSPSTSTPINATNLNKMDSAIKEHDDKLLGNTSMGNVVVDSIRSKNLISGWNVGAIDATNGSLTTITDARRTYYIEVDFTNSPNYMLSGLNISHCSMLIGAYNSSKQFLGRTGAMIQTSTTSLTLTSSSFSSGTPQGTGDIKYLIIVLYSPASGYTIDGIISSSSMQLEKGNTATTYAPFQNTNGKQFYSTVETKIGTWINGKPIYRKVVTFNVRTDVLETSTAHGISNLDEFIPTSTCVIYRTYNSTIPLSMTYPSPNTTNGITQWSCGWQLGTNITTWVGENMRGQIDTSRGYSALAILEYTKTTD